MRIPSGKTDQAIFFVALDSIDLVTRKTGLSAFTVYRSRNGGTATVYTTPTVVELSSSNMPGLYALTIDEDTTIASGSDSEEYCVHITCAAMAPVSRTIELYRRDVTSGNTIGVASNGHVSNVDTLTTYTGNTVQTGDAYARIGAAGAGLTALGDTRIAHLDADVSTRSTFAGGAVASVTGNVDGNVVGSVGSVTAAVSVSDKTGFSLTSSYDPAKTAAQAGDAMTLTVAYDAAKSAASATTAAAIKAKTDNLPADPADESLIIAATDSLASLIAALPTITTVMSADIKKVNGITVNGDGSATPWGP